MSHILITIGRQYGSGGREIGERLAKELGIAYYDTRLITEAAKKEGLHEHIIKNFDEAPTSSLLYSIAMMTMPGAKSGPTQLPLEMQVAHAQFDAILKIADTESAVIVGRCADHILSGREGLFNVFVHAAPEKRVKRIMDRNNINEDEARKRMEDTDKKRATYYRYHTDQKWGACGNYHLSIDSGAFGIEGTVQAIIESYKRLYPHVLSEKV